MKCNSLYSVNETQFEACKYVHKGQYKTELLLLIGQCGDILSGLRHSTVLKTKVKAQHHMLDVIFVSRAPNRGGLGGGALTIPRWKYSLSVLLMLCSTKVNFCNNAKPLFGF